MARRAMLFLSSVLILPCCAAAADWTVRLEAGATKREIAEVIYQMSMFGGVPAMTKALEIAQSVFGESGETDA